MSLDIFPNLLSHGANDSFVAYTIRGAPAEADFLMTTLYLNSRRVFFDVQIAEIAGGLADPDVSHAVEEPAAGGEMIQDLALRVDAGFGSMLFFEHLVDGETFGMEAA